MTLELRAGARRAIDIVLDRQAGCPHGERRCWDCHPDEQSAWCSWCLLTWALTEDPLPKVFDNKGEV